MFNVNDIQNLAGNAFYLLSNYRIDVGAYQIKMYTLIPAILLLIALWKIALNRKRKPWRIAAAKKWLKKFRKNKHSYTPAQRFAFIRKVDHFTWEEILIACFEERGCKVVRTKLTRDGGSDGYVKLNDQWVVIQAKRYKGAIAKAHVMDLAKLVETDPRVSKGLFIHTGTSSAPILEYFRSNLSLDIISGVDKVLSLLDGESMTLFSAKLAPAKSVTISKI